MADWQQSFAKRLGQLKDTWQREFHRVVADEVSPVYREMEGFLRSNGFTLTAPRTEGDVRTFKFALGEDVYVLVTFKVHGPSEVEASSEVFVPGEGDFSITAECVSVRSVKADWARRQFERALDRLVGALETVTPDRELQPA